MGLLLKRISLSFVVLLIIGQAFFFSVASAGVQPWSGNPWEGTPWEGNPWEGSPWEGSDWQGAPWEGQDWEGNGTNGNGTNGDGTTGNGTNGNGANGDGTTGNGTNGDGTNGDGTTGDGTNGDGTNGDGTTGDGTNGDGTTGDGTTGDGTNGDGTNGDGTTGNGSNGDGTAENAYNGPETQTLFEYMGNDILRGQVSLMAELEAGTTPTNMGTSSGFFLSGLLLNGLKLRYEGNPFVEGASFVNDSAGNVVTSVAAVQSLNNSRNISATAVGAAPGAAGVAGAAATWGTMGALGKLNVVGAGLATAYGVYDTFNKASDAIGNWGDSSIKTSTKVAETSEATASLGTTLMSAGVVAAAIPGGQAAATVMIVGGAALWGASKITGAIANNWDGIKKGVSDFGNGVKDIASKGWNSVKSIFG